MLSDEDDPYAVLNVQRDSTEEDIRMAYRRACVVYHPDKHDGSRKQEAEAIFKKVQLANSVLSDPHQRRVFDELGWRGIQATWQLGPHLAGTEDLLRAIEAEKRMLFSRPGQAKTTLCSHMDARGIEAFLFDDDSGESDDEGMVGALLDTLPYLQAVSIGQRFEQVMSDNLIASLNYEVQAGSGTGASQVSMSLTRIIGPHAKFTVGCGFGSLRYISGSIARQLAGGTSLSIAFSGRLYGGAIDPSFQVSARKLICDQYFVTTALVTERSRNAQEYTSGVGLSLQSAEQDPSSHASLQGPFIASAHLRTNGRVSLDLKKTVWLDASHQVKLKVSSSGKYPKAAVAIAKTFSEAVNAAASLEASTMGVVLKLSLTRYDYRFTLPIMFSDAVTTQSLFLATGLPSAMFWLANKFVVAPIKRRMDESYWRDFRTRRQGVIKRKREEAVMAQWLMQEQYEAKLAAKPALLITRAIYKRTGSVLDDESIDITMPLQMLAKEASLIVPPSSIANILGSYDIAIGCEKQVQVNYSYKGLEHYAVQSDTLSLVLPQRLHEIK